MRTHTTAALLAITGLLALPAGAHAGGWAVVQLSSTPDGLAPGTPWNVDISVLQHGFRPLDDVHPTVTIVSADDREHTVIVRAGNDFGVKVEAGKSASVTLPGLKAGTYSITIDGRRRAARLEVGGEPGP